MRRRTAVFAYKTFLYSTRLRAPARFCAAATRRAGVTAVWMTWNGGKYLATVPLCVPAAWHRSWQAAVSSAAIGGRRSTSPRRHSEPHRGNGLSLRMNPLTCRNGREAAWQAYRRLGVNEWRHFGKKAAGRKLCGALASRAAGGGRGRCSVGCLCGTPGTAAASLTGGRADGAGAWRSHNSSRIMKTSAAVAWRGSICERICVLADGDSGVIQRAPLSCYLPALSISWVLNLLLETCVVVRKSDLCWLLTARRCLHLLLMPASLCEHSAANKRTITPHGGQTGAIKQKTRQHCRIVDDGTRCCLVRYFGLCVVIVILPRIGVATACCPAQPPAGGGMSATAPSRLLSPALAASITYYRVDGDGRAGASGAGAVSEEQAAPLRICNNSNLRSARTPAACVRCKQPLCAAATCGGMPLSCISACSCR